MVSAYGESDVYDAGPGESCVLVFSQGRGRRSGSGQLYPKGGGGPGKKLPGKRAEDRGKGAEAVPGLHGSGKHKREGNAG